MPEPNSQKPPLDRAAFCFKASPFSVGTTNAGEGKPPVRTFNGTAYSGEVIENHHYWGNVIFDLDSMQIATPLAALLEHNTGKRIGVVKSFIKDYAKGLQVSGVFLSNEDAQEVAQDSDDEFPWQMSVFIDPQSTEFIEKGSVNVNGREIQAPVVVFRGGVIREISFCVLGADSNTSAVAASHQSKKFNQQQDGEMTELEKANARITELEKERNDAVAAKDTAEAELKQFKDQKRESDIKSLETELNTQFSEADKKAYTAMDDTAFAFNSNQLRQFSANKSKQGNGLPDYLFKQQANSQQQQNNQGGNGGGNQPKKFSLSEAAAKRNKS
ncbi:hypothetical protein P255_02977 [Acinetobacter brisouii CIP 110357]|uniref:HK97 family phage prohead protease n=1 Tax=Acinetobacter brisouii CIP 110357 TaxID=1341683 RepID=V2UFQ8_9GAMM|nr:hypothetical protein [Acinetobacter brisouii]ENV46190.1 hypothetical protein F954_02825 [Acinetobacter brisouii ANC 4119]ESK47495.1 hypothetical protein P255_02977 [Acinetobacter brisouii CIP 110357]